MSDYLILETPRGGPWHPTASALATSPRPSDVSKHLAGCLRCRAHALRLAASKWQRVSQAAVAALLPNSPVLPNGIVVAARDASPSQEVAPVAGELWRARDRADDGPGATAVLVWVRRVFASTALVLPVVLDIEMADDETLLLGPDESPLGVDAAVLTGVDAEVLTTNLTTRIGFLGIAHDVSAVRDAARGGSAALPQGLRTGPPIVRDDDQRIDFRQAIGEMVAAMGALADEEQESAEEAHDPMALLEELRGLGYYDQGYRVEQRGTPRRLLVDAGLIALPVATVYHMSTCVVVALLTGDAALDALSGPDVAEACLALLSAYPEADSVAVCAAAPDWPAVLLGPAESGAAIGVPSGAPVAAGAHSPPLDLVTALRKHFDGARDRWVDAAPVVFDDASSGLGNAKVVGAARARQAVQQIREEAARALIPSKRAGYGAVDDDAVAAVQALIDAALQGDDAAAAVRDLLGEDR